MFILDKITGTLSVPIEYGIARMMSDIPGLSRPSMHRDFFNGYASTVAAARIAPRSGESRRILFSATETLADNNVYGTLFAKIVSFPFQLERETVNTIRKK